MSAHGSVDLEDEYNKRVEVGTRELNNLMRGITGGTSFDKSGSNNGEEGGWINEGDEEDQRGRVGMGFPWES